VDRVTDANDHTTAKQYAKRHRPSTKTKQAERAAGCILSFPKISSFFIYKDLCKIPQLHLD